MMPRQWSWCVASASLALILGPAAGAATLADKSVSISILSEGRVREQTRLEVRIESAEDLEEWSSYPIYLDDNRTLQRLEAYAVRPDGGRVKVGRKDQDTVAQAPRGSFYDSQSYRILSFRGLQIGWRLEIDHTVEIEPYFPAGAVSLAGSLPIERLSVRVTGGGSGWRWRLDGPADGLEVSESEGGVTVTGRDLPEIDPPRWAPRGSATWPVLRYAWGEKGSWQEVGRWYGELLVSVPRSGEAVKEQARELIAGMDGKGERLEALVAFMRQKVRYVAVEVGIGGYRPTPPEEVLERRWGDCKDKALLLVDLLAEAGIEAYPALILASRNRRIDRDFPSPFAFNHLIVALPADAVEPIEDLPVGEGYLFVDPTQTRGSVRWLQPADQDQLALVIHDGGGVLARTPTRQHLESRSLVVEMEATPEGVATGHARLLLSGRPAAAWLEDIASEPRERLAENARTWFARLLPGASPTSVGWSGGTNGVPKVELVADLTYKKLVRGRDSRRSFELGGSAITPEPGLLAERQVAVVLAPQVTETTWRITLPDGWCPPPAGDLQVENTLGVFRQRVVHLPEGEVAVRRRAELRQRWIEPEEFPQLGELALAERRAQRRRLRLQCEAETDDGTT